MEELKKCPFCGGEATVIGITFGKLLETEYAIICENCEIRVESAFAPYTREEAIQAWNKRVE